MAEQQPLNQTPNADASGAEQEPLIPASYLLALAAIGFLVALIVLFTQPEFNVVGYGGLGLGVLSLVAWALLAPGQAVGVFTGRTARFGGVSLIVTLVLLTAFVLVYIFVRGLELRVDLTESDLYSLTPESREAVAGIGADPNIAPIRILAFYDASQASQRDQDTLLLEDYVEASGGKISFEFIDPDRTPALAGVFSVTRPGQLIVTAQADAANAAPEIDPATGQPVTPETQLISLTDGFQTDPENAELVQSTAQQGLTNAILSVAASGDFVAYLITVQESSVDEFQTLRQIMEESLDWRVEEVSLLELASPNGDLTLNDPNLDGEVMIIPGGTTPLGAEELTVLQTYLNNGGDLIVFAGNNFNPDAIALATDSALNDYLFATFGLRMNNDVVFDETQSFQSPSLPVATTFEQTSLITTNGINPAQAAALFEVPHSITIADEGSRPANVIVTSLIESSADSYTRADIAALLSAESIERPADAVQQAHTLAASAENTVTGAKIVLFSSVAIARDQFAQLNINNLDLAINSLIYATNFDSYFTQINVTQQQRITDTPLFADQAALSSINFITLVVLPFGVLAIGILVWWMNRERRRV